MTDLTVAKRHHLLDVVVATEATVLALVQPDKINLACLGNVVPHLHWHVIPRWSDDSHFPASIWATACRPVPSRALPDDADLAAALAARLGVTS
jgi:diadenosine tetraphosphate (Ap4A) HIT family hydrolase